MLRFWTYCARRGGKPVPRWQLHNEPWLPAGLTLREELDEALGRTVRVARLCDDRGHEVYPSLIEAQLILADNNRLILNGFERTAEADGERAQTWVLHFNEKAGGAPMRFWAQTTRRTLRPDGMDLPPRWAQGELTLKEERDDWLGRTVRIARLTGGHQAEVLSPLIDAALINAGDGRLFLTGTVRDVSTRCDVAAMWELHTRDGRQPAEPKSEGKFVMMPP